MTTFVFMELHNRKLQEISPEETLPTATNTTPPPSPPPLPFQQQVLVDPQYTTQTFQSSMALTVLVLLTALFFMGFFSIYLRRFSSTQDIFSHHHRHRLQADSRSANTIAASNNRPTWPSTTTTISAESKGLDLEIVKSLPVYSYYHGEAKYQIDCAICLGEFEEKEIVKLIPFCKHLFHLDCIDMWLKTHVTCPVCRGTKFFEVVVKGGRDDGDGGGDGCSEGGGGSWREVQERFDQGVSELSAISTAENGDTSIQVREVGTLSPRRVSSCSSFGDPMSLQGTSSS